MYGGYKLIDLKGINLIPDASPVEVPGIYDLIESTRKHTIFANYVLDGVEKPERSVNLGVKNGNFEGNIGLDTNANGLNIVISPDDRVKVVTI